MTMAATRTTLQRPRHKRQSCHYPSIVFVLLLVWRLWNAPSVFVQDDQVMMARRELDTLANNNNTTILHKHSFIYSKHNWDAAPIVVENYKLLLFTTPKVGCTMLKHVMRKLTFGSNTTTTTTKLGDSFVHDPRKNGLSYLYNYSLEQAHDMLISENWTRAVFVRNPKERVLSAYLDKGRRNNASYIKRHCNHAIQTFEEFIYTTIPTCTDMHWMPQAYRMERPFWKYVNFVGHLETVDKDVERLLQKIGAYNEYGRSSMSNNNTTTTRKTTVKHATGANDLLKRFYTPKLERQVEELYRVDYEHEILNLTMTKIDWNEEI